jgi:MFS transporter, DHA2 family, methylenomycin A resistance protein
VRPEPARNALTLALCGGYFLVLLDVTVVNVALPSIGTGLAATPAGLAWIVDAYTVPLAALLLASGAIGDRLGHRRVVLGGFVGFGLASVLCACAPGLGVLVAGRALQGVGAALMLPGTLALLAGSAPDERARTRVVAVWAAVGGCALPAGPFVGGLLVQQLGWRAVFWVNVPIILAALATIVLVRPAGPATLGARRRVDLPGAAALALLVGGAVAAIIEGPGHPAVGVLAGALALVGGLALRVVERRGPDPLLRVPGAARGPLGAACVVAGLMNLCTIGALFLLTQLFQDVRHASPLLTGLLLLPAMLPLPLLGLVSGRIVHRAGPWRTSGIGLALCAAGFAVLAGTVHRPDDLLLAGFAVWGVGLGILTPGIVTAAVRALPTAPGMASGASNTARQVGVALGVAAFGAIAGPAGAPGFVGRTAWVFAGAAVAFLAATVFALVRGRRDRPEQVVQRGREVPEGGADVPGPR